CKRERGGHVHGGLPALPVVLQRGCGVAELEPGDRRSDQRVRHAATPLIMHHTASLLTPVGMVTTVPVNDSCAMVDPVAETRPASLITDSCAPTLKVSAAVQFLTA